MFVQIQIPMGQLIFHIVEFSMFEENSMLVSVWFNFELGPVSVHAFEFATQAP